MLMTETYAAGAAGSSATASSNLMDNDADTFSERLRIKIQPDPPQFPYRDDPFELTVYLVDAADQLKTGIDVPLNVELYAAEKMVPVEKNILHIDPSTKPVMQGNGICKLRVHISQCSMALGNRKFVIHISAAPSKEYNVAPAATTEMTVIQHRLVIQEKLPELWYKDEGGRDKCMTLPIFLVNAKGERVGNRPVPLRVTLLYENEHPVLKQDILKMSPDCQRTIDSSGKAVLKLRVEDVSKNHQGQAFRLKVEADTAQSPLNFDVAYDLSSTISVRSKRNKRRPHKNPPTQITHHIITGASTPTTSSPNSNGEHELSLGAFGAAAFTADDRRKKMRTGGGSASPGTPRLHNGSPQGGNSLTGAMESVLNWTGGVVHGLHQLEWQTVGYESKSDGTADPERPIYRCPACWRYKDVMTYETAQHDTKCLIANLLLTYATDTMGHLDFVLKGIERFPAMLVNAQASGAQKASASAAMKSMPQSQMQHAGAPSLVSPQHAGGNMLGVNPLAEDPTSNQAMMSSAMLLNANVGTTTNATQFPMSNSTAPMTTSTSSGLTGMEGPPGLFRNNSGGLTEFMRSLDDQEPSDPMFYGNLGGSSTGGSNSSGNNHIADAIEMQVFYVVARMVTVDSSNAIGFPAFDASMNLLGFYQEGRENATTEVVFVQVRDIPSISQREIVQTQHLLEDEIKKQSVAVHTLARCNNDLVKLKEDVILFHWNVKDRATAKW